MEINDTKDSIRMTIETRQYNPGIIISMYLLTGNNLYTLIINNM